MQGSEDLKDFEDLEQPSTPSDRDDLSSLGDDGDETHAHVSVHERHESDSQDIPLHGSEAAGRVSYKFMSEMQATHGHLTDLSGANYGGGAQPMAISPMKHHITTAVGHGTLPVRGHDGNAAGGSGPHPATSTGVTEQYGAMNVGHDSSVDRV